MKKVDSFKYLGSVVSANGNCEDEVRKRIQSGWASWRKISSVLCDRKLSARTKGKMYKIAVRPALMYSMETVAVTQRQVQKIDVTELKMVRWALGVTRVDKIQNRYIRGTAKIAKLGDKLRSGRLRWYGHVRRRDTEYVGRRVLEMAVPGKRKRGRPNRRWMDAVKEDMRSAGVEEVDTEDRKRWKKMTRCGDSE